MKPKYYKKEDYKRNKKAYIERVKKWQAKNPEKIKLYQEKQKEKMKGKWYRVGKKWQAKHSEYNRLNREKVKLEVLNYYSKNQLECTLCGFKDIDCLAIDHINNDGAKDRKIRHTGYNIYCWLKRSNYPKGFQVLCCNCNWKKHKILLN